MASCRHLAFSAVSNCWTCRLGCSYLHLAPLFTDYQGALQGGRVHFVTPEFQVGEVGGREGGITALDLSLECQNIWFNSRQSSSFVAKERSRTTFSTPSSRGRKRWFLGIGISFRS